MDNREAGDNTFLKAGRKHGLLPNPIFNFEFLLHPTGLQAMTSFPNIHPRFVSLPYPPDAVIFQLVSPGKSSR